MHSPFIKLKSVSSLINKQKFNIIFGVYFNIEYVGNGECEVIMTEFLPVDGPTTQFPFFILIAIVYAFHIDTILL